MSEPIPETDLSGTIDRLIIERQRNGYLLTAWPQRRSLVVQERHGRQIDLTSGEEYVAADRDELTALVKRLMAEPPEGKAP